DIHGCRDALRALLDAIQPQADDLLITLGDHIDRGPDSRGVLELLIALSRRCRLVSLMGNHEEILLEVLGDKAGLRRWLECGGADTLRSYGWRQGGPRRAVRDWVPMPHQEFIARCRPYHETPGHIFLHAGFVPELPLEQQPAEALRWRVTDAAVAVPHPSGQVVVVGHTPPHSGEVLGLGFLICIDTNCGRGGWLTALDVLAGKTWQASRMGRLRTS